MQFDHTQHIAESLYLFYIFVVMGNWQIQL